MKYTHGDYKMEEKIKGGLAEGKKNSDFPKEQIDKGVKIELEHTSDKNLAKEIAKDHLVENKQYYSYLAEMEKKMDREKKEAKKKEKNEYAICTKSVGQTAGTQERSKWDDDEKERYDRCLEKVKKSSIYFDIKKYY